MKRYKKTYETVQNGYSKPLNMGDSEIHNIATIVTNNIATRKKR